MIWISEGLRFRGDVLRGEGPVHRYLRPKREWT
jgi:hypothetical protein